MKQFKMYTTLAYYDKFKDFMADEKISATDFIITNEFLYDQFVKPLSPPASPYSLRLTARANPQPIWSMPSRQRSPQALSA